VFFLLSLHVLHRKERKGVLVHVRQQHRKGTEFFLFFGLIVVGERYMPAALISNLKRYFLWRWKDF